MRPENAKRYPPDWKLRSRFVRFVRARNRCEWCGARNYEPHPITGSKVVLTTAHVYDKRPEAASLLNLAALCQRCHLNHDRKPSARDLDTRQFRIKFGKRFGTLKAKRRALGKRVRMASSGWIERDILRA